jgi:hypothetical protein
MAGTAVATVSSRKGRGVVRVDVALTVGAGDVVDAAPIGSFFGRLVSVIFYPEHGAGGTMLSTADFTLSDAVTGAAILADLTFGAGQAYRPTQVVVDSAGAAITPADTANDLNRDIFVAGKLNVAIANATDTQTGLVSLIFDEG